MSKRIQPLQDPKVQAAIEEVKRAALAVSGDLAVKNVVVLIDFKKAGGVATSTCSWTSAPAPAASTGCQPSLPKAWRVPKKRGRWDKGRWSSTDV